jgi:hypothetical protein
MIFKFATEPLFGSHLRFKSQYKFLGIKNYINNSNFSKYRLKIKNKGILICNKLEYKKKPPFKI